MFFHCAGRPYVRFGNMLLQDLETLIDADDCTYFEGFKAKVTYVIVVSAGCLRQILRSDT